MHLKKYLLFLFLIFLLGIGLVRFEKERDFSANLEVATQSTQDVKIEGNIYLGQYDVHYLWRGPDYQAEISINGTNQLHTPLYVGTDERYRVFLTDYVFDFTWNPPFNQYAVAISELIKQTSQSFTGQNGEINGITTLNNQQIAYIWEGPGKTAKVVDQNQQENFYQVYYYNYDDKHRIIRSDWIIEFKWGEKPEQKSSQALTLKLISSKTSTTQNPQPNLPPPAVTDLYVKLSGTGEYKDTSLDWTNTPAAVQFGAAVYTGEISTSEFKSLNNITNYYEINDYNKRDRFRFDNHHTAPLMVGIKVKDTNGLISGWSNIYTFYPEGYTQQKTYSYTLDLVSTPASHQNSSGENIVDVIQGENITYTPVVSQNGVVNNTYDWNFDPIYLNCSTREFTGESPLICIALQSGRTSVSVTHFPVMADGSTRIVESNSISTNINSSGMPPAGYEDEVLVNYDTYENPFPDTNINTIEGQAAAELYRRAILGGYPDGEFKGWREVNRAEAAKFLLLSRFEKVDEIVNNGQFPDVVDGQWYTKFVITAAIKNLISGFPDGTFRPAERVNTAQFLKMLTKTFVLPENTDCSSFYDVDYSQWYAAYCGNAEKYNLFPHRGNYLEPDRYLTRDEVAVAIYQFFKFR